MFIYSHIFWINKNMFSTISNWDQIAFVIILFCCICNHFVLLSKLILVTIPAGALLFEYGTDTPAVIPPK